MFRPIALLVYLVSFALSSTSLAQSRSEGLDYEFGLGARTLPIAGAAHAEAGYGVPLWGEWKDSIFYGYLRPVLRITSAATINEVNTSLRLHPISFVGLAVGRATTFRNRDTSNIVDCSNLMCDGVLEANYLSTDTILATGAYFLSAEADARDFKASDVRENFYEDGSALIGSRESDRQVSSTLTLGKRLGDEWLENLLIGVTHKRVEFLGSGQTSERTSLIGRHTRGELSFSYAAGVYRSDTTATGLAIGASIEWNPQPGIQL